MPYLAIPWKSPPAILFVLIAINRLIYRSVFIATNSSSISFKNAALYFGIETLILFAITSAFAVSIWSIVKMLKIRDHGNTDFTDFFYLSLKAQTPYLAVAPVFLLFLGLSGFLYEAWIIDFLIFLKGLFPLASVILLFFILKKHLENLGFLELLTLTASPVLLVVSAATLLFFSFFILTCLSLLFLIL
ncbi:hypothetical protein ACFL6Y_04100 [Elusimicrobiota bacterium]